MARIKKGDEVLVIAGKDKGSTGKVLEIVKDRILVEGINRVSRHDKESTGDRGVKVGGIQHVEAPIHISNLMVTVAGKPTRVGRKLNENNKLQRYAKKTGDFIK